MYKRKIKAGGVTHLTDARYFAAREVDWLGLCLDKAVAESLDMTRARAILEWVAGPLPVGEFGLEEVESIQATAMNLGLTWIQLGPHATTEDAAALGEFQLMKQIVVEADTDVAAVLSACDEWEGKVAWIVLDGYKSGVTWTNFRSLWTEEALRGLLQRFPILLAFPMSASALEGLDVAGLGGGIQVNGSVEEEVGVKSWDELEAVLDWLEIAE